MGNSLPCVIKLSSAPCVVLHVHSRKFLIAEFPLDGFLLQKCTAQSLGQSFIRVGIRWIIAVFSICVVGMVTLLEQLEYMALENQTKF